MYCLPGSSVLQHFICRDNWMSTVKPVTPGSGFDTSQESCVILFSLPGIETLPGA